MNNVQKCYRVSLCINAHTGVSFFNYAEALNKFVINARKLVLSDPYTIIT
jgi:hypothetical protein